LAYFYYNVIEFTVPLAWSFIFFFLFFIAILRGESGGDYKLKNYGVYIEDLLICFNLGGGFNLGRVYIWDNLGGGFNFGLLGEILDDDSIF
jgi:hypothetical protein